MKTIEMFESEDGQVFKSEEDCMQHERKVMTLKKIDEDLYSRDISSEEIYDFVVRNKDLFQL